MKLRFSPLQILLALSLPLLLAGLVYSVRGAFVDWGTDPRHAEEAGRAIVEAEKASGQAQREFKARRFEEADVQARAGLESARKTLARHETGDVSSPDVQLDLVEAALAFGRYLDLHPGDVEVLLLRARAWELRRFGDKAAADFKKLIELKPELAESLKERLARAQAGYP